MGRSPQTPAARPTTSAADDPSVSQSVFTITEKAPTKAFTLKNLIRHYAKQAEKHKVSRNEIGMPTDRKG